MSFKPFAAIVALALLAAMPLPQTAALSVGHGGDLHLVSRVTHSSLVTRQKNGGKRCSKYRNGDAVKSVNPTTVSTTTPSHTPKPAASSSPATTSTHTTNNNNDDDDDGKQTTEEPSKTATKETTKSTAKPTSAAPKPSSGSSKRGFIYPGSNSDYYAKTVSAVGGNFWGTYNWGANKPDNVKNEDFIPTLWGYKTIGDWGQVKRGYAWRAFGCNEVNHGEQSQMEPSEGVTLWRKYMEPLKAQGYQLYSHSTANGPSALEWWDKFFDLCDGCHIDAVNVHYYSNNPQGMIDWLETVHQRYGKNIVVSESGCSNWSGNGPVTQDCDAAGVKNFIEVTTAYMNKQPWITGYMYFGQFDKSDVPGGVPAENAFYNSDGSFTSAGKAYAY